jgi:hypothetical protein
MIEHGPNRTWTRAHVPAGVTSVPALLAYLQRGGRVESDWLTLPPRVRWQPRPIGMTVIAAVATETARS